MKLERDQAMDAAPAMQLTWRLASGFRSRLRGLLGCEPPAAATALLIPRCAAVHTLGMRYDIDIVFLSRSGRVLRICPKVAPRRARICWRAWAVAELASGEAGRLGMARGMRLMLPRDARQAS